MLRDAVGKRTLVVTGRLEADAEGPKRPRRGRGGGEGDHRPRVDPAAQKSAERHVAHESAHPMGGEEQTAPWWIPQREREHPVQFGDDGVACLLVGVDDDLGIRLRPKRVTSTLEALAQLGEIVDLPVEHHMHRVVFIGDRLAARLEIDHAQPAHAERHVAVDVGAFVVGTAMSQRGRHSPEDIVAPGAWSIDEEPGYPTHDSGRAPSRILAPYRIYARSVIASILLDLPECHAVQAPGSTDGPSPRSLSRWATTRKPTPTHASSRTRRTSVNDSPVAASSPKPTKATTLPPSSAPMSAGTKNDAKRTAVPAASMPTATGSATCTPSRRRIRNVSPALSSQPRK